MQRQPKHCSDLLDVIWKGEAITQWLGLQGIYKSKEGKNVDLREWNDQHL
jgi:hypothetical protein